MAYYYFPGTNLYLRPGYVISADEHETATVKDSHWNAFLTTSPNRSVTYRPDGVYCGIMLRENWKRFYVNESVRPTNPSDYTDPAYDWSPVSNAFGTTAVTTDNALVEIYIMDKVFSAGVSKSPAWLVNAPYNGTYYSANANATLIDYHRYTGPDLRGQSNVNSGLGPPIVDEFVAFHQALHDYISAQGWADRVWFIANSELYGATDSGYTTDFYHGAGVFLKQVAAIWAPDHIPVHASSLTGLAGGGTAIIEDYILDANLGIAYPDGKLTDTSAPPTSRFEIAGAYQSPYRQLRQAFEVNGYRANTYFAPGVANPWGYSGATVPQTASHLLWAFSGTPKGTVKDSGLGQVGDDPPGIIPAHILRLFWWGSDPLTIPLADWHTAIDTFGPPGTFAHPPFPAGYPPPPGPGYGADGPYGSSIRLSRGHSRSFGYSSRRSR